MKDKKMRLSPLYDNSSSLCAYVAETKIDQYLGNDLMLWKSLVDTKSKSIIRITCQDKRQSSHLEMVKCMKKDYYEQTKNIVRKIETFMTEEAISAIVDKYKEVLSVKKSKLIKKYLLSKMQLLREIYEGGSL